MTLSPVEIEHRRFGHSLFGMRRREVRAFMSEVRESLAQLWGERSDLREDNERLRERLSSETLADRVRRMQETLERAAGAR